MHPTTTGATCNITQLDTPISHHMASTTKSLGRPAAIHMEQGGAVGPPATGWVSHLAHLAPSPEQGTGNHREMDTPSVAIRSVPTECPTPARVALCLREEQLLDCLAVGACYLA
jgi:hypothetical protein